MQLLNNRISTLFTVFNFTIGVSSQGAWMSILSTMLINLMQHRTMSELPDMHYYFKLHNQAHACKPPLILVILKNRSKGD